LSKTNAGSADITQFAGRQMTASAETKDYFSVYVQPTYALSNKTAVFAKVGYHEMKAKVSFTNCAGCDDSTRLRGIGYGLGAKTFVSKNVYLQVEGQILDITDKNFADTDGWWRYSTKSQSLMLSAGYKF
jgi:opacity protein-like surface antigen